MMDKFSDIVKIGVSGHRFLGDTVLLRDSVFEVLENIYTRHNHLKFQIFSPLAIGADQLVAECGLENPATRLIVLLPMLRFRSLLRACRVNVEGTVCRRVISDSRSR